MSQTSTQRFSWAGAYGGYMSVSFSFDLTATVDDDFTELVCSVSNFTETHDWGTVQGGGFINVGGFMWDVGTFSANGPDNVPESWSTVAAEMQAACPTIFTMSVWGLYASDEGSPPAQSGTFGGNMAHTYTLTGYPPDDFTVLRPFTRYLDQSVDQSVFASVGDFGVTFHDLFPDYYPGANRRSGSWTSQDREGNGDFSRLSGAWRDVKNVRVGDLLDNRGLFRKDGSWSKLPRQ